MVLAPSLTRRTRRLIQVPKKLRRLNPQPFNDLEDVDERQVVFPSLNPSHVAAVDAAEIAKRLLGVAKLLPPAANGFTEGYEFGGLLLVRGSCLDHLTMFKLSRINLHGIRFHGI